MFHFDEKQHRPEDDADEMVRELSENTSSNINKHRVGDAPSVKMPVTVLPGNSSESSESSRWEGKTSNVSSINCVVVLHKSLLVGDVFRIEFQQGYLDIDQPYAKCMACRMLREGVYEVSLAFLSPVAVSDAA